MYYYLFISLFTYTVRMEYSSNMHFLLFYLPMLFHPYIMLDIASVHLIMLLHSIHYLPNYSYLFVHTLNYALPYNIMLHMYYYLFISLLLNIVLMLYFSNMCFLLSYYLTLFHLYIMLDIASVHLIMLLHNISYLPNYSYLFVHM